MYKLVVSFLLIGLVSCKKEEVQLPKSDVSIVTEIFDHSPVYMFFQLENNDTIANVNKNNLISSTNWVFTIDKRLPLHTIIPEIQKLQDKKEKSTHKKEGVINVFSYADSLHQNLAFYPFTETQFKYDNEFSRFYIKEHFDLYKDYSNMYLNFKKDGTLTIDGNEVERNEVYNYFKEFITFTNVDKKTMLHLNFDKHLTYNDYLQNKLLAWQLTALAVEISAYEFVYDEAKLPQCNCKL